eukprot:646892-Prorocentrum_minimum.AAC.1
MRKSARVRGGVPPVSRAHVVDEEERAGEGGGLVCVVSLSVASATANAHPGPPSLRDVSSDTIVSASSLRILP